MHKVMRRRSRGNIHLADALRTPEPTQESQRTDTTPPSPQAPAPSRTPKPVRFDWLCEAARQPGKTAQLALMLAWQAATASSPAVKPARRALRRFGVSRDACYDGLRRLEEAGLVHVWRLPGRLPQVILVEPGTDQPLRLQAKK